MASAETDVVTVKLAVSLCSHCGAPITFPSDAPTTICTLCHKVVDLSVKPDDAGAEATGSTPTGGSK